MVGPKGGLREWTRILAYITGNVDEELLPRNEYLAAENRGIFAHRRGSILIQAGIGARSYPIAIYSWTKSSGGSQFRRIFRVIYQLQPTCAHGPFCVNIQRRTLCFGDLGIIVVKMMRELHLAALALVAGTTIVSAISTLASSCLTMSHDRRL